MVDFRHLEDAIIMRAHSLVQSYPQLKIGLVQSYDPANHCVKVIHQPEGTMSGWLPVSTAAAGKSWGIWAPPDMGQQVVIAYHQGDPDSGIVVGMIHSDENPPGDGNSSLPPSGGGSAPKPTKVAQGELLLVGKNGQQFRFCADGTVYLKGNFNIDGDVVASGNITSQKDVFDHIGKLDGLRQHYDQHKHREQGLGGAFTDVPDKQDP